MYSVHSGNVSGSVSNVFVAYSRTAEIISRRDATLIFVIPSSIVGSSEILAGTATTAEGR